MRIQMILVTGAWALNVLGKSLQRMRTSGLFWASLFVLLGCHRPAPPLEEGDGQETTVTTETAPDGTVVVQGHPVAKKRAISKYQTLTQSRTNVSTIATPAVAQTPEAPSLKSPTDITLSNAMIAENNAPNAIIGTLASLGGESIGPFKYTLSGSHSSKFAIQNDSELWLMESANFEVLPQYSLTITTQDLAGGTFSKDVTISVTDVNEAPTGVSLSPHVIVEDNPPNAVVGTLSARDPDAASVHSFILVGEDVPGSFLVTGNLLRAAGSLSFATRSSYGLVVRATDASGLFVDSPVTVYVQSAVNSAPTDISLSSTYVFENNIINTVVGTLSTTDVDAIDQSFSYTISGADAYNFNITGDQLRLSTTVNYETKASYLIVITTTDTVGNMFSKGFVVSVLNINEAPTGIVLSNTVVPENTPPNYVFGMLAAQDQDIAEWFTYSLGGADASDFSIQGNKIVLNTTADFERKNSYQITITATDSGGLFTSNPFTIVVMNVNEAPAIATIPAQSVSPGQSISIPITASDPEDPLQCSNFAVNFSNLSMVQSSTVAGTWPNCVLNIDAASNSIGSLTVIVTASDGMLSSQQSFTLTVAHPTPTITTPSQSPFTSNDNFLLIAGGCSVGYRVYLSGAAYLNSLCDSSKSQYSFNVSGLGEGNHSFNIRQSPDNGVTLSPAVTLSWTRDTTVNVTLTADNTNAISKTGARFDWTSGETITGYRCSLNGGAWSACTSPYVNSLIIDGNHTFELEATDAVGNLGVIPVSWTKTSYDTLMLWSLDNSSLSNSTVGQTYSSATYNNSWVGIGTAGNPSFSTTRQWGSHSILSNTTAAAIVAHNPTHRLLRSTATIEFWVKPNNVAAGDSTTVLSKGTASDFSWSVVLARVVGGSEITFNWNAGAAGNTAPIALTTNGCMARNAAFTHIMITFNKGQVNIYCGSATANVTSGTVGSAQLWDSTSPLNLGLTAAGATLINIDDIRLSQIIRPYATPTAAMAP